MFEVLVAAACKFVVERTPEGTEFSLRSTSRPAPLPTALRELGHQLQSAAGAAELYEAGTWVKGPQPQPDVRTVPRVCRQVW